MAELPRKVQRVQHELKALGIDAVIEILPTRAHTAAQAAEAVGCDVGQIVKSLVFKTGAGSPVLILTAGNNRVDGRAIERLIGESIEKADAEFVERTTGFAIGGVPPVGHSEPMIVVFDEDLLSYEEVWAAGGIPEAVFKVNPRELAEATGAIVAKVNGVPD
jgi:prolyl-tRNA editing enzyme YbaK/EbsC (Cys-tRNA(Pro) deacylase)